MHRPARRRPAVLLAALVLAAAAPAPAAAQAMGELDARYSVTATGIEIGRAALALQREGQALAVDFVFENGRLLGLMEPSSTRMRSLLEVQRRELAPRRFEALFWKEDRDREVVMAYGADGRIERYRLVKRGRARVEEVPPELAPGTLDPLSALARVRAWLERAPEGDTLELAVFDGRKRYEASLRYLGPVQTTHEGMNVAAHRVSARYRLVAELDEDEGVFREAETGRERELDALLTADGRYLPLRLSGSFDGLPLTVQLAADCKMPPGCGPGD